MNYYKLDILNYLKFNGKQHNLTIELFVVLGGNISSNISDSQKKQKLTTFLTDA